MSELPADAWLDAHPLAYKQLFDDNQIRRGSPLAPDAPLTALIRHTNMSGRVQIGQHNDLKKIEKGVDATFTACREGVFPEAQYIADGLENVPTADIAGAGAQIISLWERGCRRVERTSPFRDMLTGDLEPEHIELNETQLVITILAALSSVLQHDRQEWDRETITTVHQWAPRGLSYFGPIFTNGLLEGENPFGTLSDKAVAASYALNTHHTKELLATGPKRLDTDLENIQSHLDTLSTETLMAELGWDAARVTEVFTPDVKEGLAYFQRNRSVLQAARHIQHLFDVVLTPQGLSDYLGVPLEEATRFFDTSRPHSIVRRYIHGDPMWRLRRAFDRMQAADKTRRTPKTNL